MHTLIALVRRILEHPLLLLGLALLAMLLTAPSLEIGWVLDDQIHHSAFVANEQVPELVRSPTELFAFIGPRWPVSPGAVPWWAHEELQIAFFRPLTSLSHWLDYQLWSEEPRWMHLQSLLWLGLMVFAAGLFYRRLAAPGELWIAGFAALFFALDDSHGLPAVWIANRNALLAMFFGLLTLLAYHRWRREGWRPGAFAAPIFLLLAVLSAEAGAACGAYLLSYALFLDRGAMKTRLLALAPCAAVGVLWSLAYRALGYGVYGLGNYVDPGAEPLRFLSGAFERIPLLLWGQLSFPPTDLFISLSQPVAQKAWYLVLVLLALFGLLLAPLLRRSPRARFWTFGMVLALLPSCATEPSQRLLVYASLGSAGLLTIFIVHAWRRDDGFSTLWHLAARLLTVPLLLIHLVHGPLGLWTTTGGWAFFDSIFTRAAQTFPSDPAVREQQAVVVSTPSNFVPIYVPLYQVQSGRAIPQATLTLGTGIYPIDVHRPGPRSLTFRPHGGFLAPPGSAPPGRELQPFNSLYGFQAMDLAFYDGMPFEIGQRFEYGRLWGEVDAVTDDGRPAEVTFHFDADLEDGVWRWLRWDQGGFAAWQPPAVGERTTLPEPSWQAPPQ